jgi:uroporphyrinogen decarboxylase
MTNRELFHEIMFYGDFDHMPVIHWTGWEETLERWYGEGLPRDVNIHEYLGTTPHWSGAGVNLDLYPALPEEVLEDTPEYRIIRQSDGVVCKDWKGKSCIPHFIDFTLKTAADWPDYKRRLQPDPARVPENLLQNIANAEASGLPLTVGTASMMGWIRNWMGVQGMSYLMFDDRDCYADMVMTLADLTCWGLDQVLPHMQADMGFGWEDICGKSGPLVSPAIFDECVAPGYRKIRNKLEEYGVHLYGLDSDGDVSALVGPWLEAGVNVQFPIEVGTWKGDGNAYRKQYGRDLRIIGNFDKLTLERGQADVLAEFDRLLPLLKDGGYIMMPDHLITPGVSREMFTGFLVEVREVRF